MKQQSVGFLVVFQLHQMPTLSVLLSTVTARIDMKSRQKGQGPVVRNSQRR